MQTFPLNFSFLNQCFFLRRWEIQMKQWAPQRPGFRIVHSSGLLQRVVRSYMRVPFRDRHAASVPATGQQHHPTATTQTDLSFLSFRGVFLRMDHVGKVQQLTGQAMVQHRQIVRDGGVFQRMVAADERVDPVDVNHRRDAFTLSFVLRHPTVPRSI